MDGLSDAGSTPAWSTNQARSEGEILPTVLHGGYV